MGGDAQDVNPSSAVLDEEEDVEGAHPGGLDSEEVATQDRVCLGAQERPPRQTPARRGIEAGSAEDGSDRRGRDADAELEQLSTDPLVAPARVLACEAADQVAQVSRDRWPSCLAVWSRPLSGNEIAVPSQQRVGRDDEAPPPISAEEPAGGGEEYTIGWPVRWPRRVAAKNRELLAEDDDLDRDRSASWSSRSRHT